MNRRYSRGQVLPVWIFATIANIALLLLVANLTNVIRWQIRAQNASDAAAGYGLSQLGSYANELTTELYATQVNEYRIRFINASIVDLLTKFHAGTAPSDAQTQLNTLTADLSVAESNQDYLLNHKMAVADNNTKGGLQNVGNYVNSINGSCVADAADCAFTYTSNGGATGTITADVVACKNVPNVAPAFLGLPFGSSFKAVGRSAEQLAAQEITFSPGAVDSGGTMLSNGAVGRYQPDETYGNYTLQFSNITLTNGFYEISPINPANALGAYTCS